MSSNFDSLKAIKGKSLKSIEFAQEKDDSIMNRIRLNFGTSALDVWFDFHPKALGEKIYNISELSFVPVKLHTAFDIDSIEPVQARMIDERIKLVSARYQSLIIQDESVEFCYAISINCEFRKYEIYKQSIFDNKIYISNINSHIGNKIPIKDLTELYKDYMHEPICLSEKIKQ